MKPLLTALTDRIRDAVRAQRVLTTDEKEQLRQAASTFILLELPTTTDDVAVAILDALNPSEPDARSFQTDSGRGASRAR